MRNVTINGAPLSAAQESQMEAIELMFRFRLEDGAWWYDRMSGAIGRWGGPISGHIPGALDLGPEMSPDCSCSGTGVFVNGREIHPDDLAGLRPLIGLVQPSRYFVDAVGNAGYEGGPALFNLVTLAQRNGIGKQGSKPPSSNWYPSVDRRTVAMGS